VRSSDSRSRLASPWALSRSWRAVTSWPSSAPHWASMRRAVGPNQCRVAACGTSFPED